MTEPTLRELFDKLYNQHEAFRAKGSAISVDTYNEQLLETLEAIRKLTPDRSPDYRAEMARIAESRARAAAHVAAHAPTVTAHAAEAATTQISQLEGAAKSAGSQAQSWINRVSKTKLAVGAAGAVAAVGLGVWAWKEYVSKPETQPEQRTK